MKQLVRWFSFLAATVFLGWIAWTSPSLNECLSQQYKNYSSNTFQENISGFYIFLVGSRLCIGEFIHANGEGIIAIFTVILGIATWFLWKATRDLVNDAKVTGISQINIAQKSAENLLATERPHMFMSEIKISGITTPPDADGMIALIFDYKMINYGRSPAFLSEFCFNFEIISELPPVPEYVSPMQTRYIIAVNSWYGTIDSSETKVEGNRIRSVVEGHSKFYILGYLSYSGSSRQPHKSRFCYQMIFDGHTSIRFVPDGPDSYWENT